MIKKVLIANRGEIAVRIIRACREMGIETVAVYSEADKEALHAKLADEAVCIGPAASAESYLSMDRIISATIVTGADAIHPGFGFLSENSRFAELCEQCNITFIGPDSKVIAKLGNKQEARNTMAAAGVPVIPGSTEPIYDAAAGAVIAGEVGYPVIVKAALGGGGKGMRIANTPEEFERSFQTAQKETQMAFGDNTMYIEHFVQHPRHIEFQILADHYGNVVHLGERDCSIQRNHQKMIEESPSVALSDELRERMGEAAVKAAKAAGYQNAGTIEFLLEKSGSFYFMDEYPYPGRASGHGVGHGNRSDQGTDSDRIREKACIRTGGYSSERPRHRMQDQCRESGQGIPAVARNHHGYVSARRQGNKDRFRHLQRVYHTALL